MEPRVCCRLGQRDRLLSLVCSRTCPFEANQTKILLCRAAQAVWPTIKRYIGLDSSAPFINISSTLLDPLRSSLSTRMYETSIVAPFSPSLSTTASYPNASLAPQPNKTLAISAFSLSDLPTLTARRNSIKAMWNSGAEVLVIIDRGTPRGFKHIADARKLLLSLGRGDEETDGNEGIDVLNLGKLTFIPEPERAEKIENAEGSYVVAPVSMPFPSLSASI
jgi:ribosomal protein RSM22 (predicted rRNA methylase)